MKKRCYKAYNKNYKYYGERGITICDEWLNGPFENAGGTVEIVVQVVTEMTLKGGGKLTLTIDHATVSAGGYFFTLGTMEAMVLATTTFAAGTVLLRFALPTSTYRYQKGWLATDDAFTRGTIDVYPVLIPR